MRTIYIVFDKIPQKKDGGLIATYVNFVKELSDLYNIVFVSVFKSPDIDIDALQNIPIITLFNLDIDNRFYKLSQHLRTRDYHGLVNCIYSLIAFFILIPFGRLKTRKLLRNKIVIAPAPASGIFISKAVRYLLEIHTNYEYFWGKNPIGRMQTSLMTKPVITVFRNQSDANKGSRLFPATYLYNTCEDPLYRFDTQKYKPTSSLTKNRALFVGRLVEQKNPLALIEIASRVRKEVKDFQLDIYGEGDLKHQLQQRIEELHLDNCVQLKGFIDDKTIYRNYDLLWVASTLEGFGLVIIEAASNSVPTITTNWGPAVSEVVEDGKTGFICNTQKEFELRSIELLKDTKKRSALSNNARNMYVRKFSTEAHKQRWMLLIEKYFPKTSNMELK